MTQTEKTKENDFIMRNEQTGWNLKISENFDNADVIGDKYLN